MAASTAPSAQRHMSVGRLVALEIPSVVVCSIGPLSVVDVPPPHRVMHLFASFGLGWISIFEYFFKIQNSNSNFTVSKLGSSKIVTVLCYKRYGNKVSF